MEYAVILHNYNRNIRTIPEFVASFADFKELLKLTYSKIRHLENISVKALQKGSEYPVDDDYIIYNNFDMSATLYKKTQKDGYIMQWKPKYQLTIISRWELAKFDIKNDVKNDVKNDKSRISTNSISNKNQKSSSHNQITNFKITELSQGPMFILYKDDSTDFIKNIPLFINRIDNRLSDFTKKTFRKVIIMNDINLECDGSYIMMNTYLPDEIDKIGDSEKIIIIDTNCISDNNNNTNHFTDILNNFKPNKTCIIVLVDEKSSFIKNINMAEHIMITKDVSDYVLEFVYKQNKFRDLETFSKFCLCVKQVRNQVGQIVITKGNRDLKWL